MKYVLTLALGPVQGFIATARKTRDLWSGSAILAELSKAAAKELYDVPGVELVFPGIADPSDPVELAPNSERSVANIVVAIVDETASKIAPRELAALAKRAAYARWEEIVAAAEKRIGKDFDRLIRVDFWKAQTKAEDQVEFYAAWVPLQDETNVKRSIDRAAQLLAGRKNCREFAQPVYDGTGVPKSSLDGAKESVLAKELVQEDGYEHKRAELLLKKGEQLDAVGLIKRLYAKEGYRSLLEIAIEPQLVQFDLADAEVRTALAKIESLSELPNRFSGSKKASCRKLVDKVNQEGLYVAILVADGDKMGASLSEQTTVKDRQEFSKALANFSNGVRSIVEKAFGELVYAGGDDVLAFLPLNTAVACADELRLSFRSAMKYYSGASLSAGIAIVHYHEELDWALDEARRLEHIAKTTNAGKSPDDERYGDRNGVAIGLITRGNIAKVARERWGAKDDPSSLVGRLKRWSEAFDKEELPNKFPYDLYDLLASRVYDAEAWESLERLASALSADALRIAAQKENVDLARGIGVKLDELLREIKTPNELNQFADELSIAKKLGDYQQGRKTR